MFKIFLFLLLSFPVLNANEDNDDQEQTQEEKIVIPYGPSFFIVQPSKEAPQLAEYLSELNESVTFIQKTIPKPPSRLIQISEDDIPPDATIKEIP